MDKFFQKQRTNESSQDSQETTSENKTEILRAEETEKLNIKYLLRPRVDRHEEYHFNCSPKSHPSFECQTNMLSAAHYYVADAPQVRYNNTMINYVDYLGY